MDSTPLFYFTLVAILILAFVGLSIHKAIDDAKRSQNGEKRESRLHTSSSKWLELYNAAWKPPAGKQSQTPITKPLSSPVSHGTSDSKSVKAKPLAESNPNIRQELMFESPLEQIFWNAWQAQGGSDILDLTYQYWVMPSKYRVDFAHLPSKMAVELDGYTYHSSEEQLTRDKKRERDLARCGWHVIRFSGAEITANPARCIKEVIEIISTIEPKAKLGGGTHVARHRIEIVSKLRSKIIHRQWGDVGAYKVSDEMPLEEMYEVAAKEIANIPSSDARASKVWMAWLDRLEKREQAESL